MAWLSGKPWWRDKKEGWPGHGVSDFFNASKEAAQRGDFDEAVEILQWGKRFSLEFGSGGGAHRFDEMIEKLDEYR
jgi:hypothetical protein